LGIRIRTNMASLVAQRHFGDNQNSATRTMEKLASGFRINRAADDAAGLAISETLRADVRSLDQAKRNAGDAISMIQVGEGSLDEISNILIRLRELSIQSASDTLGPRERGYLNMEYFELKDEIERIALSTEFNGTRLLAGPSKVPESLFKNHNDFPLEIQVDKNFFPDVDSLEQRNPLDIIRVPFEKLNARLEGEGSLGLGITTNEEGSRIDSKVTAHLSIDRVDQALQKVASYRSQLGAIQNRLTSTERNLAIRSEGLSAARSRIIDADFAKETAEFTQFNILRQAGASVLTNAGQLPEVALKLLQ
jgi:flagellin